MRSTWNWIKGRGKTATLRTVFVVVATYLVLSNLGIPWAPVNTQILVAINVAVLWLFLELALERRVDSPLSDTLPWDTVVAILRSKIKNRTEIDFVGSSTSSFYLAFYETIRKTKRARIRIVMRGPTGVDDAQWLSRVKEYAEYWTQLTNSKVEVRLAPRSVLRLLRVGDTVAIGGYTWDEVANRYFGHTVPMLVSNNSSHVHLFEGVFDHIWRDADPWEPAGHLSQTANKLAVASDGAEA